MPCLFLLREFLYGKPQEGRSQDYFDLWGVSVTVKNNTFLQYFPIVTCDALGARNQIRSFGTQLQAVDKDDQPSVPQHLSHTQNECCYVYPKF